MRFIGFLTILLLSLNSFAQNYYMFVGTYTTGKSEGIYVYRFNTSTGEAGLLSTIASKNPSYLAIAPNGRYLYSVNESGETGEVSSFQFDRGTGRLFLINKQSSGGADPCYISVDKTNKWALIANYSSGSLSTLPINADGSLAPLTQLIQHTGSGVNKDRQEKPPAPFTTSTLQQQAAMRMRYTAKRTMMAAQRLYEGVEIKGEGSVALITYMRTDSTRVSNEALQAVRGHIGTAYGPSRGAGRRGRTHQHVA
jgi:6-phosphogluconolactonase